MKGLKNYIIELKNPYNEKFKTESGLELYANQDFNMDRLSNRVAIVKAVPTLDKFDIKVGDTVLIDPSFIYQQIYRGSKQEYQNVFDAEKNLFFLSPDMIICYKKDNEWKGFLEYSLAIPIFEEKKQKSSIIITEPTKKEFTGKVIVKYINKDLEKLGVKQNDTVYMDLSGGLKYWLEGKEYWAIVNYDVYAKAV